MMNRQDIANKADWEGGIEEVIRGGWLRPENVVSEIRPDVERCLAAFRAFEEAVRQLNLPEPGWD